MARSTITLRSYCAASAKAASNSRGVVRLGNADGRPEIGGLDEHGKRQAAARIHDVRAIARHRHIIDNRQHAFPADTLHHLLIHGDGGRHHARADVGQVGQFEQTLHGAVLAEGAVQDGEDHVDVRDGRPVPAGSAAGSTCPAGR